MTAHTPAANRPVPSTLIPSVDPPRVTAGHLMDYIMVLYKRRLVALSTFTIVVAAASVYTFGTVQLYEAKIQLLIEAENPNIVSFKEVIEQGSQTAEFYQTQYTILRSRSLARKTLETLRAWNDPAFGGAATTGAKEGGGGVRHRVSAALGSVKKMMGASAPAEPKEPPAADETAAQSRAIDIFLNNLTVSPVKNSSLVDVKFRSSDPTLAAKAANAFAQAYMDQSLEFRFMASKEASDWLTEQLKEQKKQVENSEVALQKYREQNNAMVLGDRENIVVQRLGDMNTSYSRAKALRIEKEANYRQLKASADNGSGDTLSVVLSNPFIQQLKAQQAELQRDEAEKAAQLGDQHPELKRIRSALENVSNKLKVEVDKVVQSAGSEYASALAQEQSLNRALEAQKSEVMAMNRKSIEYDALDRDARSDRQIFESLLQRTKETGISGELKTSNIRVVDAAEVPRSPIKKRNDFLLAVCAATILSIGLTFFCEYIDSRIQSPEQIRTHLGLPFLGLIPSVERKHLERDTPLISQGVPAQFSEAFRAVRTNVVFSSEGTGPSVLLVTSTGPQEGKTVVASNLAIGLAQCGQTVLIVDADMRRPRVHKVFDESQEPGLADLLLDDHAIPELRDSGVPGLSLLSAGVLPKNPADLLGSPRFKALLTEMSQQFDWIIIDAPPVMAVTDASLIANLATGVLFVVGADKTRRAEAQAALEQLAASHASFFGAVLNGANINRHGFFFSRYYRREYAQYYVPPKVA